MNSTATRLGFWSSCLAAGFNREFERAIELLGTGRLNVDALIEHVAPLVDGPRLVQELAAGEMDLVKVLLEP